MNRYQTPFHHVPFVLAAVALTALTMALAVVLPAKVDFPVHQQRAIAAAGAAATPSEVVIVPARIEVFGVRAQETAFEPVRAAPARKRNHAS